LSHVIVVGVSIASEVTLSHSQELSSLLFYIKGTRSVGYYKVNDEASGGVLLTRVLAKVVYIFD
jgi:hypothetical protein